MLCMSRVWSISVMKERDVREEIDLVVKRCSDGIVDEREKRWGCRFKEWDRRCWKLRFERDRSQMVKERDKRGTLERIEKCLCRKKRWKWFFRCETFALWLITFVVFFFVVELKLNFENFIHRINYKEKFVEICLDGNIRYLCEFLIVDENSN